MSPNRTLFLILLAAAAITFCCSCYHRFSLVATGMPENRTDQPGARLKNMLVYALGQKRVAGRTFGLNHVVIFWSFLVLLLANAEFLVKGLFPQLSFAMLPAELYHFLLVAFDIVSLLVLLSVAAAAARRVVAPPFGEARTLEAFFILGLIGLLMLANFGLHASEIALGWERNAAWMPVSGLIARWLAGSPQAPYLAVAAGVSWWIHAVVLMAFLNYLPRSKHMHILTAIPNCFFARLDKPNTLPRETFGKGMSYGAAEVRQLTWKDLFDSFSCTECGRCQDVCPAASTGKALNPRLLLREIKMNLLRNDPRQAAGTGQPLIGEGEGSTPEEAIWACTTCGACMAVCPVLIEQMPKLVKMRRHLVQMQARFPEELLNLFENMEQRSNPWGIAPGERTKWQAGLEVKPFKAGETEYLLFVGCAGAFDSRQKQVTVALATILNAAKVSWGILGKEELCCGDTVRRLGNEYLFDRMARQNVEQFRKSGVTRIITACPHCFSTLKNDYRQFGIELEVIHHAELIDRLLKTGQLKLSRKVTGLGKLVFHDSCYLGRHNDVYDAPRSAIAQATGSLPRELGRNRENSFCCGAGGGRMWMEEHQGSRINLNRVQEALGQQPDTLCVSCPYCLTMLEDGLKDTRSAGIRVKDVAEVVADGLSLP